jgi:antitoxin (DNA-binding transcriptional repressor) of toxin-antitoxin stability system
MLAVDLQEDHHQLSQLIYAIESQQEKEIVIVHHGKAVAKLIPFIEPSSKPRLGIARGKLSIPDDIDAQNEEIARLFLGASA